MPHSPLPSVSFIIPTLNAERFLGRCLTAIRTQDYPADKIEIIVADAYSTDKTRAIARAFKAKIIDNPLTLHEHGKTLATKHATHDLIFYTDADNILADRNWLQAMVRPAQENQGVLGFLPQTSPPPDSSAFNRYLGYLFTDPLTWFIYGAAANPHDFKERYIPVRATDSYEIYRFKAYDHPLFGLSQGVGVAKAFQRGDEGAADDILSGIRLIKEGGLIAYVPGAKIYHYHVEGLADFWRKYRWRIRNNLSQKVAGMGMVNRLNYFDAGKKTRMLLFLPYGLTIILPIIDALRLTTKWKDPVMLWHAPACFVLALLIAIEGVSRLIGLRGKLGVYGK